MCHCHHLNIPYINESNVQPRLCCTCAMIELPINLLWCYWQLQSLVKRQLKSGSILIYIKQWQHHFCVTTKNISHFRERFKTFIDLNSSVCVHGAVCDPLWFWSGSRGCVLAWLWPPWPLSVLWIWVTSSAIATFMSSPSEFTGQWVSRPFF